MGCLDTGQGHFLNPLSGELVAKVILYKGVRQKEREQELCPEKLGRQR